MGINDEAKKRRAVSLDTAIDQIRNYFEFDPLVVIEIDDELFEIPTQSVWSPEQIERMDELAKFVDDELDHKEVPLRHLQTGEILLHPKTGEVDTRRVLEIPHAIKGETIDPPYGQRYLTALWGDPEKAKRAEKAGLTYGWVSVMMQKMNEQFNDWSRARKASDPK